MSRPSDVECMRSRHVRLRVYVTVCMRESGRVFFCYIGWHEVCVVGGCVWCPCVRSHELVGTREYAHVCASGLYLCVYVCARVCVCVCACVIG